jgi:hypothetical protein
MNCKIYPIKNLKMTLNRGAIALPKKYFAYYKSIILRTFICQYRILNFPNYVMMFNEYETCGSGVPSASQVNSPAPPANNIMFNGYGTCGSGVPSASQVNSPVPPANNIMFNEYETCGTGVPSASQVNSPVPPANNIMFNGYGTY